MAKTMFGEAPFFFFSLGGGVVIIYIIYIYMYRSVLF